MDPVIGIMVSFGKKNYRLGLQAKNKILPVLGLE